MLKTTVRLSGLLLLCAAIFPGCAQTQGERSTGTGEADASTDIVARINGEPITRAQAEQKAFAELKLIDQQRFDTVRYAMDQIMQDMLIEQAAAAAGLTPDELLKAEIDDKIKPPTEAELVAMMERQKEELVGRTPDEARAMTLDGMLTRRKNKRKGVFFQQLQSTADIEMLIEPPRTMVEVPSDSPSRGPADAPITIVEFGDFECHFCRRSHMVVERLLVEYRQDIRYVFADYPVPTHRRAVPASQAARCADDQGKFWDYFEHLMGMAGDLSDTDLQGRAVAVGLDTDQFSACYQSQRHVPRVNESYEFGESLGVSGTPTFFINGRMLVGSKTYPEMKAIVDEELARARQAADTAG